MEELKIYGISDELKNYIPNFDEELYTDEQNAFIKESLETFNKIAIYRKNTNERTKQSFIENLLNPNFSVQKMEIILSAVIEMFNYVSETQDDLKKRNVQHLCSLSAAINQAVNDPTYNISNITSISENGTEDIEDETFNANKYLNKATVSLDDDDDDYLL